MRSASAALLLALLAASPASAYWTREEWFGVQGETGRWRMRLVDLSVYDSWLGVGIGTTGLEAILGAWDIQRTRLPDASGHHLLVVAPVKAYWTLLSWNGPVYFLLTNSRKAHRGIGRLELFGSYCGWATLTGFNEADFGTFTDYEGQRKPVSGSVSAKVADYGVRLDLGSTAALTVGRLELETKAKTPFRARKASTSYAALSVFFGATHGSDVGGGFAMTLLNSWNWLRARLGGDVVRRRKPKPWYPR